MRNIRLTIEYDGKCYNGWQKQPDKLNIQGEIERAKDTSPYWILTNIQTQSALGSPMSQDIYSSNWERVSGSVSTPWVRLQRLQFGSPIYNPRTDAN